jgi:nicotinamidase-related amidase
MDHASALGDRLALPKLFQVFQCELLQRAACLCDHPSNLHKDLSVHGQHVHPRYFCFGMDRACDGGIFSFGAHDPAPPPGVVRRMASRNQMDKNKMKEIPADPYPYDLTPSKCALLIIDMQRDFLEPGGFGEMLGNDVSQLRRTIEPNAKLLKAWRAAGLQVIHTREGHRPDLTDLPPAKKVRGRSATCIGDAGPMGRILVRGEAGHDIIPELYPLPTEPVIDKPGKGAFFATDLHAILQNKGISQLVVTGVTTEVCVNTTVREANDRGYDCLVPEDCVGSYFPEFQEMGLKMIKAQGGIFGWVTNSAMILRALN